MVLFGVKIGQQHGKFTPDWQSPQISGILVCNEIRLELAGKYLIFPRIVSAWLCAYSVVSVRSILREYHRLCFWFQLQQCLSDVAFYPFNYSQHYCYLLVLGDTVP